MTSPRELVDRYTVAWNDRDEPTFASLVAEVCVRHDPGRTIEITRAENLARFRAAADQFPGFHLMNAHIWEHGDDTVTVAYEFTYNPADGSVGHGAGIEVFRFDNDQIVEVWNAPTAPGGW